METENGIKLLEELLCEIYGEYNIPAPSVKIFARELYPTVFEAGTRFNDILCQVPCFEEELKEEGAKLETGWEGCVLAGAVHLLEVNAANANKLYDSFSEYHDITAFERLMNDFYDFLSTDEKKRVMDIARGLFSEEIWNLYD